VRAILPADVAELRDELLEAGLSPRTVVRHLTVANGVFKHAVREHGLERNPASAELVDRPSVRYSGESDTFDGEELAALARAAADELDGTLYLAAAMTGLRQGELLALRWRDIDFASQRIHVRRSWSPTARAEKTRDQQVDPAAARRDPRATPRAGPARRRHRCPRRRPAHAALPRTRAPSIRRPAGRSRSPAGRPREER
jgi:integrase